MGTMFTPPIDLYDEETTEARDPLRDDREVGFAAHAFPDANGDRDEHDIEHGTDKLHAVLGW